MMDWTKLKLGPCDRGALIGRTGSGKTFLGRYLLEDSSKPYSVVYDSKHSDGIKKWTAESGHVMYRDFGQLQHSEEKRVIFRPDPKEALDPYRQDLFFEWVYQRQHCRLFVDEAYGITGGTNPSFHFQACFAFGRERGISTLVGMQRPARVPVVAFSEAEHWYVFKLRAPADRQRVAEWTDGQLTVEKQLTLNEHEFFYFNVFSGLHPKKIIINPI